MSRVHLMFVLSACASGASPCELSCKRLSPPHRFVYFLDVYLLFWCKLFTKLSKISRSFCFGSLSLSFSCCYSDVEPSLALSLSLSLLLLWMLFNSSIVLFSLRDGDGGVVGFSLFCFLLCVLVWSRGFCFCFFLHGLRKNLTNFKCWCCLLFASFQKCVCVFLCFCLCLTTEKSATPKCTQPKPSATLIVPKRFERPFWKSTTWQLKLCAQQKGETETNFAQIWPQFCCLQIPTVVGLKKKQKIFAHRSRRVGICVQKGFRKAPTEGIEHI